MLTTTPIVSLLVVDAIKEWIQEMLVDGTISNLSGMFDATNSRISEISSQIGKTPQSWNASVFNMIKGLSDTVILPLAGLILAVVMTLELINLVTERNNMAEIDTWIFLKWVLKTTASILLVANCWNIVMGIFNAAQHVVSHATGYVSSEHLTSMDMAGLRDRLLSMELSEVLGLWLQSLIIMLCSQIVSIVVFIIIYGRMFEIYLVTSMAPIPLATLTNNKWGNIGENYIRQIFALAFRAFLIIVCVAIYDLLVQGTVDLSTATTIKYGMWQVLGYTVLVCFMLFKTDGMAKSIFNAH
ncbi:MAG: hypothetical protein II885_07155 [Oscillospiraceae bacterium]|nr:hypothetical protein [Oscillospiraceae bacterium]